MKMHRLAVWLGCLALLFTACRAAPAGPPPAVVRQQATPAMQLASTRTPTLTPRPASTATPTPSPSSTLTVSATPTRQMTSTPTRTSTPVPTQPPTHTATPATPHPMSIALLRDQVYPGSDIVIEQALEPGRNYSRYVVSYLSDGYRIYALMTVPAGEPPATGWPAILFNHGAIPASEYRTTERYVAYVDAFARNGYVVFKSDYRGHGDSEGDACSAYTSNAFTSDVLNALSSVRRFSAVDPDRIGMWGHSMGGFLTLRAMVISDAIRAGVIWAGVLSPHPMVAIGFNSPGPAPDLVRNLSFSMPIPADWDEISANAHLSGISGPLQLHHGTSDERVDLRLSTDLMQAMRKAGRPVEFYRYHGDDHNLSRGFGRAMQRSIEFFDTHVKGTGTD